VAERLEAVRRRVEATGRRLDEVRIVAVTKGFGIDVIEASIAAGLADLGENYSQELVAKALEAPPGCRWHYLGPIQRNKLKALAPVVSAWHAVDRPEVLAGLSESSPGSEVFLQVNVMGIAGRPGCEPADLDDLYAAASQEAVRLVGLMAVAPAGSAEQARRCFRWLAQQAPSLGLRELSMGMSDDFEVALEEGATVLRLGRALFGQRPSTAILHRYNRT
jgi:hypothetical protein